VSSSIQTRTQITAAGVVFAGSDAPLLTIPTTDYGRYTKLRKLKETLYGKVVLASDGDVAGDTGSSNNANKNNNVNNNLVALKMSDKRKMKSGALLEDPRQEILILRRLNAGGGHPYVLQLLGECTVVDKGVPFHCSVLEFVSGGEVFDFVVAADGVDAVAAAAAAAGGVAVEEEDGGDSDGVVGAAAVLRRFVTNRPSEVRRLFYELLLGVAHMHRHGVAHLDLSLENLYVVQCNCSRVT
jgi:serine/threonine protein kinase